MSNGERRFFASLVTCCFAWMSSGWVSLVWFSTGGLRPRDLRTGRLPRHSS